MDGNKELEADAQLCINSPYGKWGYNPYKQRVIYSNINRQVLTLRVWSIKILNENVALASVQESNEYTEHAKSNVYISIFVNVYAHLKLYKEELEPLSHLLIWIMYNVV